MTFSQRNHSAPKNATTIPRHIKEDLPVVEVNGHIGRAIRVLKRRVDCGGVLSGLRVRKNYPRPQDRKRLKARRAKNRQRKNQRRR